MTLNTDGCSKENPGKSGRGGVLRDSNGQLIVTFSAFLGEQSSLKAEVLALLIGLRLCGERGIVSTFVQVDFAILVAILQRRCICPWLIQREVERIWQMVVGIDRSSHCVRETNVVVDILANVGVLHSHANIYIYQSMQDVPSLAREEMRLNSLGVPSIRRKKMG